MTTVLGAIPPLNVVLIPPTFLVPLAEVAELADAPA